LQENISVIAKKKKEEIEAGSNHLRSTDDFGDRVIQTNTNRLKAGKAKAAEEVRRQELLETEELPPGMEDNMQMLDSEVEDQDVPEEVDDVNHDIEARRT